MYLVMQTTLKHGLVSSGRMPKSMPNPTPVALITGAGVRLGTASARALAKKGVRLALHYRSSSAGVEALAAELRALGTSCEIFQADLQDAATHAKLVDAVLEHFGRLDVLVNNAGIYESSPFEEVTLDDFERMVAVNLRAPFFIAQAAVPALRESGGSIVNITDTDVKAPYGNFAHYFASKGGLEVLTSALAAELGPRSESMPSAQAQLPFRSVCPSRRAKLSVPLCRCAAW